MTYNAHNRLLTAALPSGRSVAVIYNASDDSTEVDEKNASGTILAKTKFTVGSYGLVSDKYDNNTHHTSYAYDSNGYLASVTTPKGNKTQWTYDALGFTLTREDALLRTTDYTPDAWERNVTTSYPDNSTSTYGYDQNGNLTAFANATGNWSRIYDADNRMTSESLGATRTVSHTYDASGQKGLLSTTTDYDGRVISYAYSARNELTGVGDSVGTTTYSYDPDGNQSHLYNPNGTQTAQYYNNDNTLHSYYDWNGGSTVFASFGYSYNTDHQITGLNEGTSTNTDTMPGPTQTTYGYDAQGHLTSEARTGQNPLSQSFGYDGVGNRTSFNNGTNNTFSLDIDDEPTGQTGVNTFVLGYNANGDRTSETFNGQATTYGYDCDDQLTSITKSGTTVLYRYDPLGRQVSKSVNGTLTGYYLDGDTVLEEKQGATTTAQYLWGNGLIRCNGEYPLTDGRANVRLTTNASQQVTSSNAPDSFGVGSVTTGTASAYAYGGAAGYREEGIAPAGLSTAYALQKVGARYYDQAFGCFLTRDTDLGQLPYAYCNGDPVNFSDPSGHSWAAGLGFAGAVIGIVLAVAFIVALSPEIGGLACIGAALEYSTTTTYFVGAITPAFTGYIGTLIGEDQDHQHEVEPPDRPEKTGGGPAAGDQTITGGEEDGLNGSNGSGNYSTPVPTTYQDYSGVTNKPISAPYTGTPHYGPEP